jgi:hypothetical protein
MVFLKRLLPRERCGTSVWVRSRAALLDVREQKELLLDLFMLRLPLEL